MTFLQIKQTFKTTLVEVVREVNMLLFKRCFSGPGGFKRAFVLLLDEFLLPTKLK